MKKFVRIRSVRASLALSAVCLWAGLAPFEGANAQLAPAAAYFGQPAVGTVVISPSGRTLAITVPGRERRMELMVADLDEKKLEFKNIAWLKDYDVGQVHWVNDQRLVFQAYDSQAGEWAGTAGLWAVDANGESPRLLIDPYWAGFRAVQPGNKAILSADWSLFEVPADQGDEVLVVEGGWSTFRSSATYSLARINTHAPKPVRLSTGAPEGATKWIVDAGGTLQVVESVLDGKRLIHRRGADGGWQELARFDDQTLEGWTPRFLVDGQLFVASEPTGANGTQLMLLDPKTGTLSKVLAAPGFDVGDNARPILDGPGQTLLGWRYRLDTRYTLWVETTMAQSQTAIDRALPGRVNEIQCRPCLSARRWLVVSYSDHEPPSYAVFDRASGRLSPIATALPDIPAQGTGARSLHRIKARDGLELPVYVTRPHTAAAPAQAAGPAPAVLYVHGGPASRVDLEWNHDPMPQFLASRGYVVIEPEFRGSIGYGVALLRAGQRQWGLAMQDDMQDAVQWAVEQRLIDPQRVCIMGASYGGYAALMGPVRYPQAYRCAISWVAPTDLQETATSWRRSAAGNVSQQRWIERTFGTDEAQLRATSPVNRAAEIRVPVLAAWGVDDRRVPIADARRLRDAMQAAKANLDYVEYADEGHVWMNPKWRIDFFTRAERLLERTLGEAH